MTPPALYLLGLLGVYVALPGGDSPNSRLLMVLLGTLAWPFLVLAAWLFGRRGARKRTYGRGVALGALLTLLLLGTLACGATSTVVDFLNADS